MHTTNFDWHCIFYNVFFIFMTITILKSNHSQNHTFSIGTIYHERMFHWDHNAFSSLFIGAMFKH